MTVEALKAVPTIAEMLEEGDLSSDELTTMWKSAPKFPGDTDAVERIDVDSFVQVYRDIDDMFEEDDDDVVEEKKVWEKEVDKKESDPMVVTEAGWDGEDLTDAEQLEKAFSMICDAKKVVSFDALRAWEEMSSLIEDGMLGEDELQELWDKSSKENVVDFDGFLAFNAALDDLFVFEDDELDEKDGGDVVVDDDDDDDAVVAAAAKAVAAQVEATNQKRRTQTVVTGNDLPVGVLFAELANPDDLLVGMEELQRWGELRDMLASEELLPEEFRGAFADAPKAKGTKDMLDEEGFEAFYDAIDAFFEDDDGEEDGAVEAPPANTKRALKEELLELLEVVVGSKAVDEGGANKMPCGLESTETEQERVLEIVTELEQEPYNIIMIQGGRATRADIQGNWELVYSSSSTMLYNEGLSGLAGGLTRFGGVEQNLINTKYIQDVEYKEKIVAKLGAKPYDIVITGDWDLRIEESIFTGKPSCIMSVTPDRVKYAGKNDKADHWKSLGPMNLLQLSYLDEDYRIMRGSTSTDTLFIWRRA